MADYPNAPVNISAEELEERVKKPIDTVARQGSTNFITSGAVYEASKPKPNSITPFELDRVYVEYEGKYTVSTFEGLNEILSEKEDLNVLYAFTFPDDSEIYDKIKGINFVSTHGLFIDNDNGKVWTYADGVFTPKNTIIKSAVISSKERLNSSFDSNVDFLNAEIVGGFETIPNGSYYASRVELSANRGGGYLLTSVTNGSVYFYNRDTETFASFGFATKEYVDNKLGDIESLLSQI